MSAPNRNTLWARAIVDELRASGVTAVVIAPGSRSTPLTAAADRHPDLRTFTHLDERSAAYFALGRGKRTGDPTALICTSGTAAANFHPAVVEADRARVPLVVLTADRPPELRDSGANQTVDQEKLYGTAVRWYKDLPEPNPDARTLRSLRVTVDRAVGASVGTPPGPVHLNVPFRKPLEPVDVPGDVPEDFADGAPLAAEGRDGPFVERTQGRPTLDADDLDDVVRAIEGADRGLLVAGPDDAFGAGREAMADLAAATGFPLLADPLSNLRFGPHVDAVPVIGGYDGYLDSRVTADWPDPDVVVRFGASPTSKPLRTYLAATDARQFLVDPAGEWREATFTASDMLVADPTRLAESLAARLDRKTNERWQNRFARAESAHWDALADAPTEDFEGRILATVAAEAPDPATLVVSNSMPVRDLDRFGRPRAADLTVLGNRGASGIDGVTSTALGAGSATDDPLVFVTGDLAFLHDANGLLALRRFDLSATVVLVDNRGGGIFHMLPIEDHDPPFTEQFKTPHGVDFESLGWAYGVPFLQGSDHESFVAAYRESVASEGIQILAVVTDAETSHRTRETLSATVVDRLS